jgi:hypothetical protein
MGSNYAFYARYQFNPLLSQEEVLAAFDEAEEIYADVMAIEDDEKTILISCNDYGPYSTSADLCDALVKGIRATATPGECVTFTSSSDGEECVEYLGCCTNDELRGEMLAIRKKQEELQCRYDFLREKLLGPNEEETSE